MTPIEADGHEIEVSPDHALAQRLARALRTNRALADQNRIQREGAIQDALRINALQERLGEALDLVDPLQVANQVLGEANCELATRVESLERQVTDLAPALSELGIKRTVNNFLMGQVEELQSAVARLEPLANLYPDLEAQVQTLRRKLTDERALRKIAEDRATRAETQASTAREVATASNTGVSDLKRALDTETAGRQTAENTARELRRENDRTVRFWEEAQEQLRTKTAGMSRTEQQLERV